MVIDHFLNSFLKLNFGFFKLSILDDYRDDSHDDNDHTDDDEDDDDGTTSESTVSIDDFSSMGRRDRMLDCEKLKTNKDESQEHSVILWSLLIDCLAATFRILDAHSKFSHTICNPQFQIQQQQQLQSRLVMNQSKNRNYHNQNQQQQHQYYLQSPQLPIARPHYFNQNHSSSRNINNSNYYYNNNQNNLNGGGGGGGGFQGWTTSSERATPSVIGYETNMMWRHSQQQQQAQSSFLGRVPIVFDSHPPSLPSSFSFEQFGSSASRNRHFQ